MHGIETCLPRELRNQIDICCCPFQGNMRGIFWKVSEMLPMILLLLHGFIEDALYFSSSVIVSSSQVYSIASLLIAQTAIDFLFP